MEVLTETENILKLSKRNLKRVMKKICKHKIVHDKAKVKSAIQGLCIYHCTNQANVLSIMQKNKIRTKNKVGSAEMTNSGTDIIQGVDKSISMSIGRPWPEYGNFCWVFGTHQMSKTALVFFKDPWQLDSHDMENYVLLIDDFITLAENLLSRNLIFFNKNIITKVPLYKFNLHKLAAFNFRNFELKQDHDLELKNADEFFVWTKFDEFMLVVVRLFWNWPILAILVGLYLAVLK